MKEARKYRLPIFLFGHSMGGLIVIRMMQETKREDVDGIILSSPCLGVLAGPSAPLQAASKILNIIARSYNLQRILQWKCQRVIMK